MKVFVTGGDGFVGKHTERALRAAGHEVTAVGGPDVPGGVDIQDSRALEGALTGARPDAVLHLAAVSSVSFSHRHPEAAMSVNALGTTALLQSARKVCPAARLVIVGSGEVYGRTASPGPTPEVAPVEPLSPYAASKLAAETVALQFHRSYGAPVVCVRSFSALGAGQAKDFAIPSFAAQIAAIKQRTAEPILRTGDMSPVRDFLHVEDVASAYVSLLTSGVAGSTYNVASGTGHPLRGLLDRMLKLAGVEARVETDPEKLRPVEIPVLVGDATRLRALGWAPKRTVEDALRDVLAEHGAL